MRTCTHCGATKALSEFYKAVRGKDGLQSSCKPCHAKESNQRRARKHRDRRDAILAMFDRKCSHCERAYPDICFDLHHTDPSQKEFHFNDLGGKCWARIEKEVSKCILLCSNCHRIEHDRLRKLTK